MKGKKLAAQVCDSHLLESLDILTDFHDIFSVHMAVYRNPFPYFPSEKLIQRHICHLSFDIPQCHINAGNGVIFNWSVSPVTVLMHELPQLLNILSIPPQKKRF